ncbi:hypothetical protein BDZ89DRAFT_1169484 [Hymenopellis radicata]|nr:hypothetical protein BDZ89DRAFT_1169484 [Hymenopellis radicata]
MRTTPSSAPLISSFTSYFSYASCSVSSSKPSSVSTLSASKPAAKPPPPAIKAKPSLTNVWPAARARYMPAWLWHRQQRRKKRSCRLRLVLAARITVFQPQGRPETGASSFVQARWKNGGIIASLILGPTKFLIILPIYEKPEKVAKHPLIPNLFWKNRVVMLAVVATFFDAFGAAISSTYMYSWMVVTQAWTIKELTYFNHAEWQVLTVCGIVAGLYMLCFKRYKWLLVFGCAVRVLAFGLQLQYRQPQQYVRESSPSQRHLIFEPERGLLVMVRVLQGLGSGFSGQILGAVCQFEVLV